VVPLANKNLLKYRENEKAGCPISYPIINLWIVSGFKVLALQHDISVVHDEVIHAYDLTFHITSHGTGWLSLELVRCFKVPTLTIAQYERSTQDLYKWYACDPTCLYLGHGSG
jgi:hypothetical protein